MVWFYSQGTSCQILLKYCRNPPHLLQFSEIDDNCVVFGTNLALSENSIPKFQWFIMFPVQIANYVVVCHFQSRPCSQWCLFSPLHIVLDLYWQIVPSHPLFSYAGCWLQSQVSMNSTVAWPSAMKQTFWPCRRQALASKMQGEIPYTVNGCLKTGTIIEVLLLDCRAIWIDDRWDFDQHFILFHHI